MMGMLWFQPEFSKNAVLPNNVQRIGYYFTPGSLPFLGRAMASCPVFIFH
jgi:hypothetical protein